MTKELRIPISTSEEIALSFPSDHVLLITLNRPKALNAMTPQMENDITKVFNWFDDEPELWVAIITGAGRIFCAGADLKAWNNKTYMSSPQVTNGQENVFANTYGFGAISRRATTSKPIICAVNGGAYGGGMELLLNCDIVIAEEKSLFALPEVKRGVIAAQGGIPRLARITGHQLASEMLLLGKTVTATEARDRFRFVNEVVPPSSLLETAIKYAEAIVANSPDAVQSTKRGLINSLQHGSVEEAFTAHAWSYETKKAYAGENIKEGLKAFSEKRKPKWSNPSKL